MRRRVLIPALIGISATAAACGGSSSKSTGPAAYTLTLDGIPPSATEGDTVIAHVRVFTPDGVGAGVPVTFIIGEGSITSPSDTTDAAGRDSAIWVLPFSPGPRAIHAVITTNTKYTTPVKFVQVMAP